MNQDGDYFECLALYTWGCPGLNKEDVCGDPAECAADGRCRILVEQNAEQLAMEGTE